MRCKSSRKIGRQPDVVARRISTAPDDVDDSLAGHGRTRGTSDASPFTGSIARNTWSGLGFLPAETGWWCEDIALPQVGERTSEAWVRARLRSDNPHLSTCNEAVIIALLATDTRDVVIAQALGEYAAVSSVGAAFSDAWLSLTDYLLRIEPSTWMIVAACLLGITYFWTRPK